MSQKATDRSDGKKRMEDGDGVFFAHKGPELRGFRKTASMENTASTRMPYQESHTDRLMKLSSIWTVRIKPLDQEEFPNT